MPSFHDALPWLYRVLCVAVCRYPRIQTFRVSTLQCLAPSLVALLAVAWAFVGPLLLSTSQHRYLVPFLGYVFLQQLLSYAAILLVLVLNISAAPLVALMTSIHLLGTTRQALAPGGITAIPNLVPQGLSAGLFLLLGELLVIGVTWWTTPRVNLSAEDVLMALFVPEAVGSVTRLGMWIVVSLTSP
jgi:hypothetical protein